MNFVTVGGERPLSTQNTANGTIQLAGRISGPRLAYAFAQVSVLSAFMPVGVLSHKLP